MQRESRGEQQTFVTLLNIVAAILARAKTKLVGLTTNKQLDRSKRETKLS